MNVLSLFDGMSCGQIALNRLGIEYENYFASEIDKYAMQVTMANYPNTKQLGSVVNVDGYSLPKIDLLIGGSPCQSFSFAGKRKGMSTKDEQEILTLEHYLQLKSDDYEFEGQSYLFWEYMRLLNETKPRYFLLENVAMSDKWEKILSRAIGVNPVKINSNLVSAQNRERLYWTNIGMESAGLFGDLTSIIRQPKDRGILLKDILQDNPNATYYLSDKMIQYVTKETPDNFKRKLKFSDVNDKAFTLTQSYTQRAGITNYIVEDKKETGVIKLDDKINDSQSGAIYSVDGKSVSLCANGGGQGAKTGLYKVDEKYYLSEQQADKVLGRTGVDPSIDEPKILDVYNKKIKEDGKSITLTDPCHNNLRLIEPIVGQAGYEKGFKENNKASTLLQRDYKGMNNYGINVVLTPIPVDEKYYLSDKMIAGFERHKERHTEKGTGFKWKPKDGHEKGNALRANAALCPTDNSIKEVKQVNQTNLKSNGGTQPYQQDRVYDVDGLSPALAANKSDLLITNTLNENQIKKLQEINPNTDKSGCLTEAIGRGGSSSEYLTMLKKNQIITSRIRRLTPIECERLQTVPDNYTNYVSDTQRYKMLGNGWTIEVIAHILSYMNL